MADERYNTAVSQRVLGKYQTALLVAVLRPVQTNATCWAQHVAFVCPPCWAMLHVGICCVQFETSQTFCLTYANISFVLR